MSAYQFLDPQVFKDEKQEDGCYAFKLRQEKGEVLKIMPTERKKREKSKQKKLKQGKTLIVKIDQQPNDALAWCKEAAQGVTRLNQKVRQDQVYGRGQDQGARLGRLHPLEARGVQEKFDESAEGKVGIAQNPPGQIKRRHSSAQCGAQQQVYIENTRPLGPQAQRRILSAAQQVETLFQDIG